MPDQGRSGRPGRGAGATTPSWTCRYCTVPARTAHAGGPTRRTRCDRPISVMVGHSGVGKSTLVNRLVPDADRAVGVGQRGRQGPAHLDQRDRAAAAGRRRLDHRHARGALLRPRPRHTGQRAARLPRPGARHRRTARPTATTPARGAVRTPPGLAARWMHSSRRAIRAQAGWRPSVACWPRSQAAIRPTPLTTTLRATHPATPTERLPATPVERMPRPAPTLSCDDRHTLRCHSGR